MSPTCVLSVTSLGSSTLGFSGSTGVGSLGSGSTVGSTTFTDTVSTSKPSPFIVFNPLATKFAASIFSLATNVYVIYAVVLVASAAEIFTDPATVSFTVNDGKSDVADPFTYSKLFASYVNSKSTYGVSSKETVTFSFFPELFQPLFTQSFGK